MAVTEPLTEHWMLDYHVGVVKFIIKDSIRRYSLVPVYCRRLLDHMTGMSKDTKGTASNIPVEDVVFFLSIELSVGLIRL